MQIINPNATTIPAKSPFAPRHVQHSRTLRRAETGLLQTTISSKHNQGSVLDWFLWFKHEQMNEYMVTDLTLLDYERSYKNGGFLFLALLAFLGISSEAIRRALQTSQVTDFISFG